jgi:hypothetical protein
MTDKSDADAAVARSQPSRLGSLINEFHPLQILYEKRVATLTALDECGAASFWFGVANLAPKLALGKVTIEDARDFSCILLKTKDDVRVLPYGSQNDYWYCVLDLIAKKTSVALLPEWVRTGLAHTYKLSPQQSEFVIETEKLRTLPGGRLMNTRNLVNKARRLTTFDDPYGKPVDDYLVLNRTWYRQNAESKFRTYDKVSIDWMLNNWDRLCLLFPDLRCLGVRDEAGRLISFTIASALTVTSWSAYTERFDRNHPIQGCNWLAWSHLANHFAGARFENDGTADTTALRHNKSKVLHHMTPFFRWEAP